MSLLDTIPEIQHSPEAAPVSPSPRPADRATTGLAGVTGHTADRRSVLRALVVGGSALAMTMLGWVTERLPAFAVTRTSLNPGHCMNTNHAGDAPCWGPLYIGAIYCAADGYHRIDTVNTAATTTFYSWEAACPGGAYAGWFWYTAQDELFKCWDGRYSVRNNATGVYSGPYSSCCRKSYGYQ